MARALRVVALVSIIALLMTAAAAAVVIVGGGTIGIYNQAVAQQMTNQTMAANPDFDTALTGTSEVPPVQTTASGVADLDVEVEDGQRL